jgi:hypothetical protein
MQEVVATTNTKALVVVALASATLAVLKNRRYNKPATPKRRGEIKMPNWVMNRVSIKGNEVDLEKFIEKAKQPYQTYHKGDFVVNEDGTKNYDETIVKENAHESPLSFWNFKKPENEQLYFGASDYKPEGYDKLTPAEQMAISLTFASDGWYDWNLREWGTKWDACNAEQAGDTKLGEVSYAFDTAWSPAEDAFRAMVEQHPELNFEFYCEEEQGWGVEYVGENGELSVSDEWNIPESHSDYKDRDNLDGCNCNNYEPDEWFDDCPDNPKQVEQAVQAFEDISELI